MTLSANRNGNRVVASLGIVVALSAVLGALDASGGQVASLEARIAGAERVVIATARTVSARWRETPQGDRIIVSTVLLDVAETLKGVPSDTVWLELEGGTVDGITLHVSSLPLMEAGERAVFFLDSPRGNVHRPYLRGHGILPLDEGDVVRGTSLALSEIRSRARGVRQ